MILMSNASDIIEYDRSRSGLYNAAINRKYDSNRAEQ